MFQARRNVYHILSDMIKVSISRKKILKFSLEPKNDLFLEARGETQKYFRSFFGSNENFKICFWDLLTFMQKIKLLVCALVHYDIDEFVLQKCKRPLFFLEQSKHTHVYISLKLVTIPEKKQDIFTIELDITKPTRSHMFFE